MVCRRRGVIPPQLEKVLYVDKRPPLSFSLFFFAGEYLERGLSTLFIRERAEKRT